jgi:hypothetical protein
LQDFLFSFHAAIGLVLYALSLTPTIRRNKTKKKFQTF